MKVKTEPKLIDEVLTRGVHDVFGREELREKLLSGKQLHIKLGTDVTGKDLHLGHAVIHRKLRDFQDLGHRVTLIIGDFTTLVGDHSDKVDMRTETNVSEISEREQTYRDQFFKTVHADTTTIRHNSEWLGDLSLAKLIPMMQEYTVQQMFDRETFKKRFQAGNPIGFDEWIYPIMQGYDSVVLNPDVELGGTDQTFNLLAGRRLMPLHGQEAQAAIAMKLLLGSDGRPMGKSLQNYIPITAAPADMYGKIMSVIDAVVWDYFELVTRVSLDEIEEMKQAVAKGENPMVSKKRLAREIVGFYHGEQSAIDAEHSWEETFSKGVFPEDAKKITVKIKAPLVDLLIEHGFVASKSEFRRLVEEGAITFSGKIEEKKIIDPACLIEESGALRIGKKRFLHIEVKKSV